MAGNDQLFEQLEKLRDSKTLIVGIGNTLKSDDGAGPLICEQLKDNISAEVIDAGTVPENYIQKIIKKAPQNLLIIDAIDFGASPGDIKIFETDQISSLVISTHTLSPELFVNMIRQEIETAVYFIGIQPAQTTLGEPVSEKVDHAIGSLVDALKTVFPPVN